MHGRAGLDAGAVAGLGEVAANVLPGEEELAVHALGVSEHVLDEEPLLLADERDLAPAGRALCASDEHASLFELDVFAACAFDGAPFS